MLHLNIECSENIWQLLFIRKLTLNLPKLLSTDKTITLNYEHKMDAAFKNLIGLFSLKSRKVLNYVS